MNPSDSSTLNMATIIHAETLEEIQYTIQLASERRKHKHYSFLGPIDKAAVVVVIVIIIIICKFILNMP
jgi:hypothetical protein